MATVSIDGSEVANRIQMRVELGLVDRAYFETVRIRLLAGREFTSTDVTGSASVAIVNETFVRRAWPGDSPAGTVGRTFLSANRPVTIVGVAADSKYSTLSEPPTPFVYRPQGQRWDASRTLFVRMHGDPSAAARTSTDSPKAVRSGQSAGGT